MKKLFLTCLIFVSFLNAEHYKVVTSPDYPPFDYIKGGAFVGVDADLLHELSQKIGFTYEIISADFDNIFPILKSGKADFAISAIGKTKEREAEYDFSVSYFEGADLLVTYAGNKELLSAADVAGKVVTVVNAGSLQEDLAKSLNAAKVVATDSIVNSMILVKTGKADVFIVDSINAAVVLDENFEFMANVDRNSIAMLKQFGIDKKLEIFHIHQAGGDSENNIAFAKGKHGELQKRINAAIGEIRNDGTMAKILTKYGIKQ